MKNLFFIILLTVLCPLLNCLFASPCVEIQFLTTGSEPRRPVIYPAILTQPPLPATDNGGDFFIAGTKYILLPSQTPVHLKQAGDIVEAQQPENNEEPLHLEEVEPHPSFLSSLRENIINTLENFFSPYVTVFVISMLPIFELRGSIPVGINYFRLNPLPVYLLSIAGNMVPIFFVLLFFDFVTRLFSKIPILKKLLDFIFERTRKRTKLVEKYEELALVFFVAIPLPITGAWTGSLASYLLGLRFWKSILYIFIGVFIASIIVTTLSLLGKLGGIIALTVLTLFFLCKLIRLTKEKYNANRKDVSSSG